MQQLVKDAHLEVRGEIGVDRRRRETALLKLPKPSGESGEGRSSQLRPRFLKARVNRMGLTQDDERGIPMSGEEFEPAAKTRFKDGAGTVRCGMTGGGIERLEGVFQAIVERVQN